MVTQDISATALDAIRHVAEHYEWRFQKGLICQQTLETATHRLKSHIQPFLGSIDSGSPKEAQITRFVDSLYAKGLASPTCKQILFLTRKVLERAKLDGLIEPGGGALCPDDYVCQQSVPRGGFRLAEYRRIVVTARALSDKAFGYPRQPFASDATFPAELPLLIRFMVNCFTRPTDLKNLCHKHVGVIQGQKTYLRLHLPESKRHRGVVVTMPPAVRVYDTLRKIAISRGAYSPDAPVFYSFIEDRKKAMMAMDHHFRRLLERAGLRRGERGQLRTLYSLRHTAITLRLLYGEGIDLLTLAKNARTSVQMIERFYASELTPEMNIDLIQSRRRAGRPR
jgi:hypothetical protein